jgi:hypothetical protein
MKYKKENSMFKKCIILATAIVAVLALVGCKDKKKTGGQTAETTAMPSHGDGAGQTANNEIAQEKSDVIETAVVEAQNEDEEMQEMIDFDKLVLKGDVYYLNNKPFTGKAGYQKEMHEEWEFKDGKFHGEYGYYMDGCTTIGNYRNGKKHGKWESWCYDYDEDKKIDYNIEMWEDGVLISK